MSERDELATLLYRDGSEHRYAAKILEAGYRRPRTITTDAELEDLPAETIIRDSYGDPITKDDKGYWHYGEIPVMEVKFPAVVLWEPNT